MITTTDMALDNRGADARNYNQILTDLERLQSDIRKRITEDKWDGLLDLIVLKGKWEQALANTMNRILDEAKAEFFDRMYDYSTGDQEVIELIKSKMAVVQNDICKAVNARKMLANFTSHTGNTALFGKIGKGSFLDKAG